MTRHFEWAQVLLDLMTIGPRVELWSWSVRNRAGYLGLKPAANAAIFRA